MGVDYSKVPKEVQDKIKQWEAKNPTNQQLQVLSDIATISQEMLGVLDDQKELMGENAKSFGALLSDARESLIAIKDKEPEEAADFATPVIKAVEHLGETLQKAIDKIEVKPEVKVDVPKAEAPNVTVNSPEVFVDLKGVEKILRKEIPDAFKEAISLIPSVEIPEATDRWDEVLEWLESIDKSSRKKMAFPNQIVVTNADGSEVGGSSSTLATAQVSIEAAATQIVAARTNRRGAQITQLGTSDVYIGAANVTTSTGLLLIGVPGSSIYIPTTAALYGIVASGTNTLSYMEIYG